MTVKDLIQHIESPYRYEYAFYGIGPEILEKCPYFKIGKTYSYENDVITVLLDYEIEDFSISEDLCYVFEISLLNSKETK